MDTPTTSKDLVNEIVAEMVAVVVAVTVLEVVTSSTILMSESNIKTKTRKIETQNKNLYLQQMGKCVYVLVEERR